MEFNHCVGAKSYEEHFKCVLYRAYENISSGSDVAENLSRFGGIGLAVCSAAITLIAKVATIAEAVIKGLCNLLVGFFTLDGDRFGTGLKQLTVTLIVASLDLVIRAPLHIAIGSIVTIFATLMNPRGYAKSRSDVHAGHERTLLKIIKTEPQHRYMVTTSGDNGDYHEHANLTFYC